MKGVLRTVGTDMSMSAEVREDLEAAYGNAPHGTFTKSPVPGDNDEFLTDYQPLKLSSSRVFCLSRGTMFHNPVLFVEQALIVAVFFGFAGFVYFYFKVEVDKPGKDVSVAKFLREQENKMRAFAAIMTGLATFLLSFYTAITVGRWWTMRTAGVGAIKTATVDLQLLLAQHCPQEDRALAAVQRYGRASLMLIFLWRSGELKNLKKMLTERRVLEESECDLLLSSSRHCLHETIWSWQTAIVASLRRQGKIESDRLFAELLQKCQDGRAAAQCIHTHLVVRVPFQYVHLLGLIVKMHNMIIAIIMGTLFGAAYRNGYTILCVQLFGRVLILPFLFNAILLINCDLADPFNGGEADFPVEIYQANIGKDCAGIVNVSNNLPALLQDKPKRYW